MNKRIEELQREIDREKINMGNCNHTYSEPFYNPMMKKVGYGEVQDGAGSDPHWSYAGYRDEPVDRWTKTCTKCGHDVHTDKQKPVISNYTPDFGN